MNLSFQGPHTDKFHGVEGCQVELVLAFMGEQKLSCNKQPVEIEDRKQNLN